ncbi:MAG: AbrB/MazE/SpoVT family DNA-binding domain-containing protein [Candidatus Omnitrophica bacterium]|nr:AbrB/MazE/SpoVT family DNA-binding domain-containing protein [Candidatus Omnitrophota bacterium]
MEELEVTKISSKGQVVLPLAVRNRLHLSEGEKLIVFCDNDTVILKKIERPVMERFKELLKKSRAWAKKVRLTPADVEEAIRYVRSTKKR